MLNCALLAVLIAILLAPVAVLAFLAFREAGLFFAEFDAYNKSLRSESGEKKC